MEEEFTFRVLNVLNGKIVEILQHIPINFRVVVVGGKAINTLLRRKYRVSSLDWDLSVTSTDPVFSNSVAQGIVAGEMVKYLKQLRPNYQFRLGVIEEFYKAKILDIGYELNPNKFLAYTGASYQVGHINLVTDRFGRIPIIDLTPISFYNKATDIITIDNINYLNLKPLEETLTKLVQMKGYHKKEKALRRLRHIKQAIQDKSLSCNYYKLNKNVSETKVCISDTFLGPKDTISQDKRIYPQTDINAVDIKRHDKYIQQLTLKEKKAIKDYTGDSSAKWNNQLNHNAIFADEPVKLAPGIITLQDVIENAPPLTKNITVFITNRYFFIGHENRSNFDFHVGDIDTRPGFTSSSYDNQYNPYAFIDLFSPGVAYAITIPVGSRVLIVGKHSSYPQEKEIIFPVGSSFLVNKVGLHEITYRDSSGFWYDEMITYSCTYRENTVGTITVDIPQIKNEDHFDNLVAKPGFVKLFAKLWQHQGLM